LHSTFSEKGWRKKINHPFRSHKPFVMHLGEGTDPISFNEIDAVAKSNFFRRKIIAIHGVAMNEKQAAAFHGLVWCPASNYLLLGKTAAIDHLMKKTRVVFGTDSTLTASGNAWKQFRQGIETRMVTEEQLLSMLTNEPAQLWGLQDRGMIEENKRADLIIVPQTDQLFALDPKDLLLVISKGKLVLYDESIENTDKSFDSIVIGGRRKYVAGNISSLIESIKRYDVDVSLA
jgi:cytosine/adenosine deaminase-related metal-dependent hydrolase